jgi:DNA-binding MarR family transcriptional regulator
MASVSEPKHPNGKTIAELARELGEPRTTIEYRIKKMVKDGRCKVCQDVRNNRQTNVYVLEANK